MSSDERSISDAGRVAAAVLALIGLAALGLQVQVDIGRSLAGGGTAAAALWKLAGYYTILTNIAMAGLLAVLASGRRAGGSAVYAAVAVYATMLGLLNHFLLGGIRGLEGWRLVADLGLHYVTPPLILVFWFAFCPKTGLRWVHPLWWLIYPVLYSAYALLRGRIFGWYPYFVLDAGRFGLGRVLANIGLLALGFTVAGLVVVGVARIRGRIGAPDPAPGT